jgi:transposase-like protein
MTTTPETCPFCRSYDLRALVGLELDVTGYRCHDCHKTFYVPTPVQSPEPEGTTGKVRKT